MDLVITTTDFGESFSAVCNSFSILIIVDTFFSLPNENAPNCMIQKTVKKQNRVTTTCDSYVGDARSDVGGPFCVFPQ